ncbi:unnamed protein product [Amoebophrya sp. A25]|nr:unnamed protein product [Amoebophrya sp. A25]|eukprot:GSA25T00010652001.1
MRRDGLDIESVGSARDSPSDEGTPSDECGGLSPGKDAEAHALLRRKHVPGKEQRDLGSVPSAPPPLLKDQRGKETGGKKNRPRSTCDRRRCAFSWCRVGTFTTIVFLFSACFYFYHDAVLEFLGEKGSLIGQLYPFAAEPSSSTLQTSQEEVVNNCGLVTCGMQDEAGGSSSTASALGAAAEEKAADQKAVGTSSTSTIGNGAADPSTSAGADDAQVPPQEEATLDEESLDDLECDYSKEKCMHTISYPDMGFDRAARRENVAIGLYMCPGQELDSSQNQVKIDKRTTLRSLFAGRKSRSPISCSTFTKKFINDAVHHQHGSGQASSIISETFHQLGVDNLVNIGEIAWGPDVNDDDACCFEKKWKYLHDDEDTHWPGIFGVLSSTFCTPNPQTTCQWRFPDGHGSSIPRFPGAGDMLCRQSHGVKFWNSLGNILFPAEQREEASTCEMITRGLVHEKLVGVAKGTPMSEKVHDWFAKQDSPFNALPVWSDPAEADDTACCVNEKKRMEDEKQRVEANALQCVPIKGACMVNTRMRSDMHTHDKAEGLAFGAGPGALSPGIGKAVGEYLCRKSSVVMQNQVAAGISDCASITRKLVSERWGAVPDDQSTWSTAFRTPLGEGALDMRIIEAPETGAIEWSNPDHDNPVEQCCETTQEAIKRRAEQLSKCVPTKLCPWSLAEVNGAATKEPAGKNVCGLQDRDLSGKVAQALFPDDLIYNSEGFRCSDITAGFLDPLEKWEALKKAHGWSSSLERTPDREWDAAPCCMSNSGNGMNERVFEWIAMSTACEPVKNEACDLQLKKPRRGTESTGTVEIFSAGEKLCHASSANFVFWRPDDYKELEGLAKGLFSENQGQGEIRCDTITRKFLGTETAFNAIKTVLGTSENELTWKTSEGEGDTICCKSKADEGTGGGAA